MRNLTIKRAKRFVACLVKMKVYIEDPLANDLVINNVYYRKLGSLKSGEEKTFQIPEYATKVLVIADKLSKNYCNDFYQIPEGQEDIYLFGKNEFNPITGNAFRFDGIASEDVQRNRRKGLQKGIIVMCVAITLGFIIGILISIGLLANAFYGNFGKQFCEPKVFTDDGISITLTSSFTEADYEGFTTCFDSADVAVFTLKEEFSLFEGFRDYTLEQYGELVAEANGLTTDELKTSEDLIYFEYDYKNNETEQTYTYYVFLYKEEDAFWIVQFATSQEDVEEYSDDIFEWANSVEFVN